MNTNQKNILNYLSNIDASTFSTIKDIAGKIGISETECGSECVKLSKSKFLDPDGTQLGEKIRYRINTLGQLQIDKSKNNKTNLFLTGLNSYGTIVLAIATIVLAVGTIGLAQNSQNQTEVLQDQVESLKDQTELFQKDFDYTNRPWIGVDKLDVREDRITMVFKNYGKIPNDPGVIHSKFSNVEFTQNDVQTKSNKEILHVTMPGHILDITVRGEEYGVMMEYGKNGTWTIFLGAELEYQYGEDKKGNFGFMGKFNNQTGKIDIFKTWQS